MNVEEMVRDALAERASDVAGIGSASRATAARREAQAIRVRRGAGAVAGLVAVAALAGWVGTDLLRADAPPDPVHPDPRVIEVVDGFMGRTLITSGETHDGEPLVLSVDAPAGSEWLVTCAGVGPEYVVHRSINGDFEDSAPCGPLEVLGDTMSFRWSTAAPAGNDRELRLWITDSDGTRVEPDGAILAAAVYDLPDPVVTLAGNDIVPVESSRGEEWTYLDSVGSEPGDRRLTHTFPAIDEEALLELASDPVGATAQVELVVDGLTPAERFQLGTGTIGDTLTAGESHTVTLRIVGEVPDDALLAIIRRVGGPPEE